MDVHTGIVITLPGMTITRCIGMNSRAFIGMAGIRGRYRQIDQALVVAPPQDAVTVVAGAGADVTGVGHSSKL